MRRISLVAAVLALATSLWAEQRRHGEDDGRQESVPVSKETEACINCHEIYTPGIVRDWLTSRHSRTTPAEAFGKPPLERRISSESVPQELAGVAVGCYECHARNPQAHKDNFRHKGFMINVVVSPADCRTCHDKEFTQYAGTKKAHAVKNLLANPVYHTLVTTVTGVKKLEKGALRTSDSTDSTLSDTCLGCHGTKVEVRGMKTVMTKGGELPIPDLANWPNQGVGRENPDGSIGSCTSCHPRHSFSIALARSAATCGECHLEPDVPAYNVYKESKHGNIYETRSHQWNMTDVPWRLGVDFTAPTCATCHNSLVTALDGSVIAERTHDFGARLWVRLFGLPYTHPQPKSGNTSIIVNADGLPLPTTFTGTPASQYLITADEQAKRKSVMSAVCTSCHSTSLVGAHFDKLDRTIRETDAMTLAATQLLVSAWERGAEEKSNPFDGQIERLWVRQWLFYGNSVRYASAMTGSYDYAAFKNGWWDLSENLQRMKDMIELKSPAKKPLAKQ